MHVFSKVKQIKKAEEVLSSKVVENPCSEKRKALKRKRNPTAIKEDNSEEYSVPKAKSCERRKKETLDAYKVIHGGDSANKQPALDGIWLTLIRDSKPSTLINYLVHSKKIVKRVFPQIVKKSLETFEHSMLNKIRSVKVLYSNRLISKEKYKGI